MYDVIILGGGPAGYNAAERSAERGFKTLLIEKNKLGGVCLNEGCIPSKSLIYSAKVFGYAKKAKDYGVELEGEAKANQKLIVAKKDRTVRRLVLGISNSLKAKGVTVMQGEGFIVGKATQGISVAINGETLVTKKLIIATGSVPVIPRIIGIEKQNVITSREALSLTEIPDALIVIGGGVIGLEMAGYYAGVGSRVTVVEALDRIGGNCDREISTLLQKTMEKNGVQFFLNARVTEITDTGVVFEQDGERKTAEGEKVLISVGRKPVINGFGLENLDVRTEKGRIVCDDEMKTSDDDVYAIGDCNGRSMLAHTAYREGEVAVNSISGIKDKIEYNTIPSVIYTEREVASVGETVESAEKAGIRITEKKLPLSYSGRFVAECGYADGLCKLIVDEDKNVLIGAQLYGSYASEIIVAIATFIGLKLDIEQIKKIVFPHPSVGEIIHLALYE